MPEKHIILNDGCCPVHTAISPDAVRDIQAKHPEAQVLSHPECAAEILEMSDYVGSTSDLIEYARRSESTAFIVCTEKGVEWTLRNENPHKSFYFPKTGPCCPDMKLNTAENLLRVLESEQNPIEVSDEVSRRARLPLDRMLELAK